MQLNQVYHLDNREGLQMLPEKCANLIIADPPYFEVKGEFDFVWKSFDEYLEFMEGQANLYKRILADNGTLIVYGSSKKIAYVQVLFDNYFDLESNVTVHVYDRQTNKITTEDARGFINTSERFLMYTQDDYNLTQCVYLIRDYIREEIIKSKGCISLKAINTALGTATNGGGVASACLSLDKTEPTMLTKEMYEKLQDWCYPFLRKEYELLRKEYELLRRPFNPSEQHKMDVLRFSQEGHITGKYDHDTVKPEKLTRALILTCSLPNDLVVVPFAGSGTECAMAAKEGRRFIGFDTKEQYVTMSNKRAAAEMMKPDLFRIEQYAA